MKTLTKLVLALGFLVFLLTFSSSCGHLFWKHKRAVPFVQAVVDTLPTVHGWMNVDTKPGGFVMLFDQRYRYLGSEPLTTPALVPLPPGTYDLTLRRTGYVDWRGLVWVSAGETTNVLVVTKTLWSEEAIKRQERFCLRLGAVLLFLLLTGGWILRNKY